MNRIYFVDFARSFAIALALFDHSMNDFAVWSGYSIENYAILKSITSSATPTFLLLFGMMLEIVYLKRLRKSGWRIVSEKLIVRSFQCYLGFFLTALAGFVGGLLTLKATFAAMIFVGNAHFGNILKLYTFMLLLAMPILWIRHQFGIAWVLVCGFGLWAFYPILNLVPHVNNSLSIFTSYFLGFGGMGGPSILNSISIVTIGMLAGKFAQEDRPRDFLKIIIVLLAFISLMAVWIYIGGWEELRMGIFQNIYRRNNHPAYCLFGISIALAVCLLFMILIPRQLEISGWKSRLLVFGRSSLMAFTTGNLVLNLTKTTIDRHEWNLLGPMGFVVLIFILLTLYEGYFHRIHFGPKIDHFLHLISSLFKIYYLRPFSNWILSLFGSKMKRIA